MDGSLHKAMHRTEGACENSATLYVVILDEQTTYTTYNLYTIYIYIYIYVYIYIYIYIYIYDTQAVPC